jgi:hypothetical protein
VRRDLERIFDYRRDAVAARLGTHEPGGIYLRGSALEAANRSRAQQPSAIHRSPSVLSDRRQ